MRRIAVFLLALFTAVTFCAADVCAENGADNEFVFSENDEKAAPSDWAAQEVEKAGLVGITETDTEYRYDEPITREQFCELVYNTIRSVNQRVDLPDNEAHFSDTDNEKILCLARLDIVKGKSEDLFAPNDLLTREEAATLVIRMVMREMPPALEGVWHDFDDGAEISDWALNSIQAVCELGYMLGTDETHFSPKGNYTVEQAIVTLARVYKKATCFVYETPFGTIESRRSLLVPLSFTERAEGVLEFSKDGSFSDSVLAEKPVRALVSGTGTADAVLFDDVAALFGGTWSLRDEEFYFEYDPSVEVSVIPEKGYPHENLGSTPTYDTLTAVRLDRSVIFANGKEVRIKGQWGGRVYDSGIILYDGELYLPAQTIAEILGYSKTVLWAFKA